jgi:hypothetical protein
MPIKKNSSSFAAVIAAIHAVGNPEDPTAAHALSERVQQQLSERFHEETDGAEAGPFRRDRARARLDEALDDVDETLALALQAGACRELLDVIRAVRGEVLAAYKAAPERPRHDGTSDGDSAPTPAAWAQAKVESFFDSYNSLPDFLRDL